MKGTTIKNGSNGSATKNISYIMNTKNWWGPLLCLGLWSIVFCYEVNDSNCSANSIHVNSNVLS